MPDDAPMLAMVCPLRLGWTRRGRLPHLRTDRRLDGSRSPPRLVIVQSARFARVTSYLYRSLANFPRLPYKSLDSAATPRRTDGSVS
jgi:hypothetical protein